MKIVFVICYFFIFFNMSSQKTEVKICLNSGLYSYTGDNAEKNSKINLYSQSNSGYTNNPFGSQNGFCYSISLDLKKVTTPNYYSNNFKIYHKKIIKS
jgi:hypothetical protein